MMALLGMGGVGADLGVQNDGNFEESLWKLEGESIRDE